MPQNIAVIISKRHIYCSRFMIANLYQWIVETYLPLYKVKQTRHADKIVVVLFIYSDVLNYKHCLHLIKFSFYFKLKKNK